MNITFDIPLILNQQARPTRSKTTSSPLVSHEQFKMQIATFTSILALAASATATTVYGTLQMWYDENATCTQDTILYPEGQSLALGTLDSCEAVTPGVDGAEFKLFEGIPLTPLFGCKCPKQYTHICFLGTRSPLQPND